MTKTDDNELNYKNELMRKSIHLCSLSIPIIYYFIERKLALFILVPLASLSLILDFGRHYSPTLNQFILKYFGFMLRKHEIDAKKKNLNGATYVFLSAALVVFIFPKVLVITAFSVLIISDIMAALIGRKFGRHKFLAKSLEGTSAFFVSACLVVLVTPKIEGSFTEYLIGFIAVAFGAVAENISYGWSDDNLTVPLTIGVVMWLLYIILLPGLSLILPNLPY
ncbi:MAG: dolichol kinase [bacterium]